SCELDSIFDCFSTGVHQECTLFKITRGDRFEFFCYFDVVFIGGDGEKSVCELCCLCAHCSGNSRIGVTNSGDTDTAAQVNNLVSIYIDQDGTGAVIHIDICQCACSTTHRGYASLL